MMYTEFEATVRPMLGPSPNPNEPYTKGVGKAYTKKVNQHIPFGFCIYSKFAYGEVPNPLKLYRGVNCRRAFCDYVKEEARRFYHMFSKKPMEPLTSEEWNGYNRVTKCPVCF